MKTSPSIWSVSRRALSVLRSNLRVHGLLHHSSTFQGHIEQCIRHMNKRKQWQVVLQDSLERLLYYNNYIRFGKTKEQRRPTRLERKSENWWRVCHRSVSRNGSRSDEQMKQKEMTVCFQDSWGDCFVIIITIWRTKEAVRKKIRKLGEKICKAEQWHPF